MKTLYKFLRTGMKSQHGNCTWKVGEWKHEDVISLCSQGFHASERIMDALSYVPGEILAQVEVKGNHFDETDKQVWTDMSVVKAWHWTKEDSVALAIFAAELVIVVYEKDYPGDNRPRQAIEAAKTYLVNPSGAAEAAARAAGAAAEAAAGAAEAAARAAGAAARAAVWAAVWAARAAGAEILDKINNWMVERISSLKEVA